MSESTAPTPEGTRGALIAAGLHLFGLQGFAATSTREIAARAGTNVASIAYHFGGKAGLHLACAQALADRVQGAVGAPAEHEGLSAEQAAVRLETMLRALVRFMLSAPGAADLAAFILREVTAHGEVLDALYEGFIGPKHRELCQLWAAATGQDAEAPGVQIAVFAMIGQVIYFRIGAPVVQRRLALEGYGPEAIDEISDVLAGHLHAALERSRT